MTEIVVLDVNAEEDLQSFSKYLWSQGVSHRILEQQDRKLLLVGHPDVARQVLAAYEKISQSSVDTPEINIPAGPPSSLVLSRLLAHLPVTLSFIVLSVLGFFIVYLDRDFGLVKYLTFFEFEQLNGSIVFSLPSGQYWRLLTPIFLHFGLMHIAFNMTLLWFIGQRIELLQGSARMLGISLLIGLGSNIMQATFADVAIFGGMSGVVYGLLGYGWIWGLLRPEKQLHIPNALLYFSLFMMLLGFAGLVSMLGAGEVANLAHLGGFIMGTLTGLIAALIDRHSQP